MRPPLTGTSAQPNTSSPRSSEHRDAAPVAPSLARVRRSTHAPKMIPKQTTPPAVPSATPVGTDSIDLRRLLRALQLMREGDFSARLPGDWTGLGGKIADAFNEVSAANSRMERELQRIGEVVGTPPEEPDAR